MKDKGREGRLRWTGYVRRGMECVGSKMILELDHVTLHLPTRSFSLIWFELNKKSKRQRWTEGREGWRKVKVKEKSRAVERREKEGGREGRDSSGHD